MIERWLDGVVRGTREHWQLGHEIALCGRLIKGYGSTNERGKENLLHVLDHLATAAASTPGTRAPRRSLRRATRRWPTKPAPRSIAALAQHGAPHPGREQHLGPQAPGADRPVRLACAGRTAGRRLRRDEPAATAAATPGKG